MQVNTQKTANQIGKITQGINRSREIGANFFFRAADGFESLGEIAQAAEMQQLAAKLLSQSDSPAPSTLP